MYKAIGAYSCIIYTTSTLNIWPCFVSFWALQAVVEALDADITE
jgi:hypothetical protein